MQRRRSVIHAAAASWRRAADGRWVAGGTGRALGERGRRRRASGPPVCRPTRPPCRRAPPPPPPAPGRGDRAGTAAGRRPSAEVNGRVPRRPGARVRRGRPRRGRRRPRPAPGRGPWPGAWRSRPGPPARPRPGPRHRAADADAPVVTRSPSPRSTGSETAASRRSAIWTASWASPRSGRMAANSSPPRRATLSDGRSVSCNRRATTCRSRSPTSWPRLSFTVLKR